ncbi:uncharacterized protein LOC132739682 isoform X2 [Ruditapes philippinarum]|uniref:uncharacterized protein LOC132739682 isoform X2 n=1 Tax=Ruditapes philippinarum TaxID=129788 RepID=UPI00295B9C19|nr:uncharacterized protein LOC132739682 isoform X2 [Ruditapes philippinarum]
MDTCNLVIFMDKSDSSKIKNNFNEDTYQEIQDMPTTVIAYRLSVYFSLCLTVSSLYLPEMKEQTSIRQTRSAPFTDPNPLERQQRSIDQDRSQWGKRSVYNVFSKMMTRHANRHNNDKVFVDKMFNLFDLDGDRVIERREFKAVLQILGIVSHRF